MSTIIAKIRKNASQELWVTLGEFNGEKNLDLRIYFNGDDGFTPTRKGIALQLSEVARLAGALEKAIGNQTLNNPLLIQRTDSQCIRVYRSEYMGHLLMNIRLFYITAAAPEGKPSQKGISFNVNLSTEVSKALALAQREIQRQSAA